MSISNRLLATTADLTAALDETKARGEGDGGTAMQPRTGPGQMLAAREAILAMQSEIDAMRRRLEQFDGSLPTVRIDPLKVRPTRWANRHETSFAAPTFGRLKESIALAGGNAQPILVRQVQQDEYEVAFGHRRHRACLELGLPVLAVVWTGPMSDMDLFLSMDRENRERTDPSAYEQGMSYLAAIEGGLFPSQRRLAETLGVSHTWIRKAMMVAQLPTQIIQAFASPLVVQPKHAEEIKAALDRDPRPVLRRAALLSRREARLTAGQVVAQLIGRDVQPADARNLVVGGHTVGTCRHDGRGKAIISIDLGSIGRHSLSALGEAVAVALTSSLEGADRSEG
jgi:ParB family chromosome partitioning protein